MKGTFGAGSRVVIQVSDEDGNYRKADNVAANKPTRFTEPGCVVLNATGTYYVRAVLDGVAATTSVTVTTTQ